MSTEIMSSSLMDHLKGRLNAAGVTSALVDRVIGSDAKFHEFFGVK